MTPQEFSEQSQKLQHAMQSGVAMDHTCGSTDGSPKHLRVGVNSALLETSAIAGLLIRKGLVTQDEYFEVILVMLREEVARYEEKLSGIMGKRIHLG